MPPALTKKQSQVFDFIKQFVSDEGYAPSYREIADYFELSSPATAYQHVKALIDKGYLESGATGLARSIEVVEPEQQISDRVAILPFSGLITAGEPIEAVETNETIAVPADFVVDKMSSYVLRVKGESMIDDGILDGDYVVVERNNYPKNGDVVVALLDNSHATLKRFYKEDKRIRLQPANKTMSPIYVRDVIIQGVVRAVIRRFQTLSHCLPLWCGAVSRLTEAPCRYSPVSRHGRYREAETVTPVFVGLIPCGRGSHKGTRNEQAYDSDRNVCWKTGNEIRITRFICVTVFLLPNYLSVPSSTMPRTLAARTWVATKRISTTQSFFARLTKKRVRTHNILVIAA